MTKNEFFVSNFIQREVVSWSLRNSVFSIPISLDANYFTNVCFVYKKTVVSWVES